MQNLKIQVPSAFAVELTRVVDPFFFGDLTGERYLDIFKGKVFMCSLLKTSLLLLSFSPSLSFSFTHTHTWLYTCIQTHLIYLICYSIPNSLSKLNRKTKLVIIIYNPTLKSGFSWESLPY